MKYICALVGLNKDSGFRVFESMALRQKLKLTKEKLKEDRRKFRSDILYQFAVKIYYYHRSATHVGVEGACSTYDPCER